jgi:hypothetical protein
MLCSIVWNTNHKSSNALNKIMLSHALYCPFSRWACEVRYTFENVFRIRCIEHHSYLVTKSALPNSWAWNDCHTTEARFECSWITSCSAWPWTIDNAKITVFSIQQPSPACACLLVCIEFLPLAQIPEQRYVLAATNPKITYLFLRQPWRV